MNQDQEEYSTEQANPKENAKHKSTRCPDCKKQLTRTLERRGIQYDRQTDMEIKLPEDQDVEDLVYKLVCKNSKCKRRTIISILESHESK